MLRMPRILVVGGGIGGLAAALALERQHAEVILCEQSPGLSKIGAGIGIAPNAIKALRALGLEDDRWNSTLTRVFPASKRWYKLALHDRDPPERWSKGRATLLGDSAHAMLPYLGQGAAMAIEDGCVLAGAIAREADNLERALFTYERRRRPRAQAAVLGSRARARARENHLTSPWARLKRDMKYAWRKRFGSDKTVFEAGRLYDYDPGRELA